MEIIARPTFLNGSSPRAWGIQGPPVMHKRTARFIPTCVGNTPLGVPIKSVHPVHPHVRGEYCLRSVSSRIRRGSSPRAWGIRCAMCFVIPKLRFIPTCVGNTNGRKCYTTDYTVHPHVRGEYDFPTYAILSELRFIPTCVGNTRHTYSDSRKSSVHPHVRGEYETIEEPISCEVGSSPRAWGIHDVPRNAGERTRFIPTCVGNTGGSAAVKDAGMVHPHVRGEYVVNWNINAKAFGSSPRAWGIHSVATLLILR